MKDLYKKASSQGNPFYPEIYNIKEETFVRQEEVHLVDQLLTAIQLEKLNLNNDPFWSWLTTEWEKHHSISGRYDRKSQTGNEIESAAVYGFAAELAIMKGKSVLAREWAAKGFNLVNPKDRNFEDIHFFDLVWNAPE
jgi:hypothetical protein